jgi:hypothetical protein
MVRLLLAVIGLSAGLAACASPPDQQPRVGESCAVGGCYLDMCADSMANFPDICSYVEAFQCYRTATCERQDNGKCGWTATEELVSCLLAHEGGDLPPLHQPPWSTRVEADRTRSALCGAGSAPR